MKTDHFLDPKGHRRLAKANDSFECPKLHNSTPKLLVYRLKAQKTIKASTTQKSQVRDPSEQIL
jgi:hypothetical protein